jgi:hypothetical protein
VRHCHQRIHLVLRSALGLVARHQGVTMITATTVKLDWHGLNVTAEVEFAKDDMWVSTMTATIPGSDFDLSGYLAPFACRAVESVALDLAMEGLR